MIGIPSPLLTSTLARMVSARTLAFMSSNLAPSQEWAFVTLHQGSHQCGLSGHLLFTIFKGLFALCNYNVSEALAFCAEALSAFEWGAHNSCESRRTTRLSQALCLAIIQPSCYGRRRYWGTSWIHCSVLDSSTKMLWIDRALQFRKFLYGPLALIFYHSLLCSRIVYRDTSLCFLLRQSHTQARSLASIWWLALMSRSLPSWEYCERYMLNTKRESSAG